jgi:hypothetical protein
MVTFFQHLWLGALAIGMIVDSLVDEHACAEMLSVAVGTLRIWRCRRVGPRFIHIRRCVRYRVSDIQDFIKAGEVPVGKRASK